MERWMPIPDYEGWYDVSSHGRVRSWNATQGRRAEPLIMSPELMRTGYYRAKLCRPVPRKIMVARLVLTAFVGPRPTGMTASHLDGDRSNNCVENLIWESMADNNRRKLEHGTAVVPRGEQQGASKLTDAAVREIREAVASGTPQIVMAEKFAVSANIINCVVHGRSWAHLPVLDVVPGQRRTGKIYTKNCQRCADSFQAGASARFCHRCVKGALPKNSLYVQEHRAQKAAEDAEVKF